MTSVTSYVLLGLLALKGALGQLSFQAEAVSTETTSPDVDARLGLLASTLGVAPVPGAGVQKSLLDDFNEKHYGGGGPQLSPGARCECVLKQHCPHRPGSYPPHQSGGDRDKGPGQYVDPGLTLTNPELDGAGNIDIRIVNRPPPGVVCGDDQIFCCGENGRDGPVLLPGSGGTGGHGVPPPTCGMPNIINVPTHRQTYGEADFGEYPWFAVILSGSNNYIGAGALLDSSHVLTVAHKVKDFRLNQPLKVRFGEWNAQDDSEPYKNVEIEVARVDIHPSFNAENLQNDVAIIKLAQPLDIYAYPHIKTVCLPRGHPSWAGRRCWVAGFGKDAFKVGKHSYYLREVDVPILDSNECEGRLKQTRLGGAFQLNRRSFICAGGEEGKDACTGDGGSPLVCKADTGEFQVVGLVAWGIGCATYSIPGVYVNVPSYSNWIIEKLAY